VREQDGIKHKRSLDNQECAFPLPFLGVLPVTIASAVQSVQHEGTCSYPAYLFIDVLAKVGYVKNATSII